MTAINASSHAQSQEENRHIFIPRKKLKTSDLPLSAVQRSTIDTLHHTIKKKGVYDALRKQVWSEYVDSVSQFLFIYFYLRHILEQHELQGVLTNINVG